MTEVNENSDSGINSAPIQLSEDDWLQLLQKLTPSSIESLQQTLRRLQTPEVINTTEKGNSSIPFVSCSSAVLAPQPVVTQAHPIVMSLGMPRTPIAPVVAMPHVLNISKNTATPLPGRIVLPSSALLIAPPAHGQTYSLDSCLPVADLSRLVVTSGCLPSVTSGLLAATTVPESFSSLNTLANAAVAMAANASHWSSSVSVPTTTTTTATTTVQMSNSFRFSPIPFTSISTGTTISTCNSVNELIHHSTSTSNSEFTTPILSSLGSTGLTVYPVHVSANGSTVLVATASTTAQDISKSHITTNSSTSSAYSTSFGNYLNSTVETSSLSPLSITCSSNLSSNAITSPTPILTSTPRGKPKFKALWESTLSSNEKTNQSIVNESLTNLEHTIHSVDECTITSPTLSASSSTSRINRSNKRQSPMPGVKSIGQTPKRLAATAATLSQENKTNSSDGSKKFLLICSPSKNVPIKSQIESDSGICLPGNLSESILSKSTSSCTELDIMESCNSNTRQLITNVSDDRVKLLKTTERNNNISLKQSNLLHSTGSNVSSSRDSSDIVESDPIVSEVFIGKTFESGRRSLKEEPVSDDEARRRAKRRERNRVAAAKCRQRRQDQIEELQHRVDALTRTGQELRASLHSLDLERARLESLVEEHKNAGCSAAEKILSMNRNYSESSGLLENCLDHLKTDDLIGGNTAYYDDKLVIVSSTGTSNTTMSERLSISSSNPTASHLSSSVGLISTFSTMNSTTGATVTVSSASSSKSVSNHLNAHSNLSKSELRLHNRLTTSFVPLIPNTSNNNNNIHSTVNTTVATTRITTNNATDTVENIHDTINTSTTTTTNSSGSNGGLIINSSEDQNRLTSSTSTKLISETSDTSTTKNIVTRFVSRPSTLLPSSSSSSSSLAQPLDLIKAQRQALSKVTDGINQINSSNLTPCFWSSDLQNLSPILTPSTWKLLKNLTSSSNITANTTTTTTNNNNNNNNINNNYNNNNNNNNSIITNSIQQSFLLTPTVSPLYPVLPAQSFTSITSMESLKSVSNPITIIANTTTSNPTTITTTNNNNTDTRIINNDNNSNTNLSTDESNSTKDVNNNFSNNSTTVTATNNTTYSSFKTTFNNCDNNNNSNNNNNNSSESPSIPIKDTITTTTTTNNNNNNESSCITQLQQSTQLNGQ
ncbi:unnamed protein product [Schistosoma turkestanicum]|nr:unnamed protein product [Schistosoma turkestanicum]